MDDSGEGYQGRVPQPHPDMMFNIWVAGEKAREETPVAVPELPEVVFYILGRSTVIDGMIENEYVYVPVLRGSDPKDEYRAWDWIEDGPFTDQRLAYEKCMEIFKTKRDRREI